VAIDAGALERAVVEVGDARRAEQVAALRPQLLLPAVERSTAGCLPIALSTSAE
jgi:hypothetical protein